MKRVFFLLFLSLSLASLALKDTASAFPEMMKTSPPAPQTEEAAPQSSLSGTVLETLDGGGYTYVHLDKGKEQVWVAVPKMHIEKGQTVSLKPGINMGKFESKTLKRTFDNIIFSAGPMNQQTEGPKAKAAEREEKEAKAEESKIEKASGPNAYTIAEIFKSKDNLDKQNVVIRAKVIKVSEAILGKNWIHLRDGSDPADAKLKLVATSQDLPAVGDVVTVSGTIYLNRDFGSGYKYNVIMEETKIVKP